MVFPGGSGNGQAKAIGAAGIEAVRNHVRGGGGYLRYSGPGNQRHGGVHALRVL